MKYISKIYKIILITFIFAIIYPFGVIAEDKVKIEYKLGDTIPENVIDSLIAKYATGTKAYQMKKTLYCEAGYKNIQSNIIKDGVREDSWGISQIWLPAHKQVNKEQALDPEFAVKFMSDNWGKVKWYGYIAKTDSCNII